MAKNADALVAFWDSKSKGTEHMIAHAREKGLKVKVVEYAPVSPRRKTQRYEITRPYK